MSVFSDKVTIPNTKRCPHTVLSLAPSIPGVSAGYNRPTAKERNAAATSRESAFKTRNKNCSRKSPRDINEEMLFSASFPAPIVLPQDDLYLDPNYPPQSLSSWIRCKDRNEVSPTRNTVYVVAPPEISTKVKFMHTWSLPQIPGQENPVPIRVPHIQDLTEYLSAYYHGMSVKSLSGKLSFTTWDSGRPKTSTADARPTKPRFIGLADSKDCVRIRTRASKDGIFPCQLNLDDLLDVAIGILPSDAYALLLLVQQDLYEDTDDVFVCGRAYGGSRVAVVSTARYHPNLDHIQNVEREHAWPASHCSVYMKRCCDTESKSSSPPRKKAKKHALHSSRPSADDFPLSIPTPSSAHQKSILSIQAALSAHNNSSSFEYSSSTAALADLWLGRVARTASHELGHCFGIDHCVYYACVMQGSASLTEDVRQPPYICSVDLAKLLRATGTSVEQRYLALIKFCDKHQRVQLFAAFAAWIRARLLEIQSLDVDLQ